MKKITSLSCFVRRSIFFDTARIFITLLMIFASYSGYTQNAIVGSGFTSGWGSACSNASNFTYFSAGAGSTYTSGALTPNGTGNQYWRFGVDWSSTYKQLTNTPGSDVTVSPNTTYTLNSTCTSSGALLYSVPSTSYRYVFKTTNAGTSPTGTWVFFEIQGTPITVSSVSQNPVAASVTAGSSVTVTATLSGNLPSGQAVYLRYTSNSFSTSTVTSMSGSGTSYSATIPAGTNTAGASISYYIFTSGTANVSTTGSNADLYTINLNNNSGSNYTYSVPSCTSASEPTTQASSMSFSSVSTNSMTVSWTNGNGANRIVLARSGAAPTGTPSDQTAYTASATYASGTAIGDGYVVYKGTGNSVTVSGLTASTTYYFKVFEFNGSGCPSSGENYLTSGTPLSSSQTTSVQQTNHTITIDGSYSDWAANENFSTGATNLYVTWDASYIYVRLSGGYSSTDRLNIAIDNNPGTNDLSGSSATGTFSQATFAGYLTPEYVYQSTSETTMSVYSRSGTSWSGGTSKNSDIKRSGSESEMRFSRSDIGLTSTSVPFGIYVWLSNSSDVMYGSNGSDNPGSAGGGRMRTCYVFPTTDANRTINSYYVTDHNNSETRTLGVTTGIRNLYVSYGTATCSSSMSSISGDLTIASSSTFNTPSSALTVSGNVLINGTISLGSDVKTTGNWTVGSAGTQTNNSKAVWFNNTTADQTISKTGGGTVYFDYLLIDKATSGNVILSSSPATDVVINTNSTQVLQLLNTGGLDLNGRSITLNNSGGQIYVNGTRTITSSVSGGKIEINQYKQITNNSGTGSLNIGANVTVDLNANGNLDFGKSGSTYITTLNGTLSINSTTSCFVNTNPPIYGTNSLLRYNSGGTYNRSAEWSATSGAGYPYNVKVSNSTLLDLGNGGTSTARSMAGVLTIDNGSTLSMAVTGDAMTAPLTIGSDLTINGTLILSSQSGGNLQVGGNWARSSGGVFTPNKRKVTFAGSSNSAISAPNASSRDFYGCFGGENFYDLTINKSAKSVTVGTGLGASANNLAVRHTLTLSTGTLNIGDSNLVLVSRFDTTAGIAVINTANAGVNYSGNGRFVVQRYIANPTGIRTWRFLTAPLRADDPVTINQAWQEGVTEGNPWPGYGTLITGTGGTANGFDYSYTNKYSIEWLNSSGSTYVWENPANTNLPLMSHSSWALFIRGSRSASIAGPLDPSDNLVLEPKGKINIGDTTVAVNSHKFNMVGNPYPSQISMTNVVGSDNKRFRLWDPKAFSSYSQTGKYVLATYDVLGWSVDNSGGTTWKNPGTVESGEAFLTDTSITTTTLTFHESDKVPDSSTVDGLSSRPAAPQVVVPTFFAKLGFYDSTTSTYQYIDGTKNLYYPVYSASVSPTEDYIAALGGVGSIRIAKDGYQLYIDKEPSVQAGDIINFNTNLREGKHRLAFYSKAFDPSLQPWVEDSFTGNETAVTINDTDSTFVDFDVTADPQSNKIDRFSVVFRLSATLPVKFVNVKAWQVSDQNEINLQWIVDNQADIKYYLVEKSSDGIVFKTLKELDAQAVKIYNCLDANPADGINYYRIKYVSVGGAVGYSQVVKVNTSKLVKGFNIYPNPIVKGKLALQLNTLPAGKYTATVINAEGSVILKKTWQHLGGSSTETLSLGENIAKGSYKLIITSEKTGSNVISFIY